MFEGSIVPAAGDMPADESALRMPAWAELVARLAAAQDLRRAMAFRGGPGCGNFERFALRDAASQQGERLVNLDDLSHGKATGSRVALAADGAATGDREIR